MNRSTGRAAHNSRDYKDEYVKSDVEACQGDAWDLILDLPALKIIRGMQNFLYYVRNDDD
jgi:hypothetical protein